VERNSSEVSLFCEGEVKDTTLEDQNLEVATFSKNEFDDDLLYFIFI